VDAKMKLLVAAGCALLVFPTLALAASKKATRFWNLTGETLTEVSLAPAGTTGFGPNQCANDKDGSVDFDENLIIKGVTDGRYDIRVKDDKGRVCFARNIEVKVDATFSVRDKDLVDCAK
jgi:hypothetical protein